MVVVSWFNAFKTFFFFIYSFFFKNFVVITGCFLDLESSFSLKFFLNSLGCSNYNFEYNFGNLFDFRFFYLLNMPIIFIENLFFSFFVCLDLRTENPLLNSRFRKSFLKNTDSFFACSLGSFSDYHFFPVFNFGILLFHFLILFLLNFLIFIYFFFRIFFFLNF